MAPQAKLIFLRVLIKWNNLSVFIVILFFFGKNPRAGSLLNHSGTSFLIRLTKQCRLFTSCFIRFSHVRLFAAPWTGTSRLLCPWDSPGKNTGVGYHVLLRRIFPTQGSSSHLSCLLHLQAGSLSLEHLGSPRVIWENDLSLNWDCVFISNGQKIVPREFSFRIISMWIFSFISMQAVLLFVPVSLYFVKMPLFFICILFI